MEPNWRQLIKSGQHREGRSPHARWLQLATVGVDGSARVRTIVFRAWSGATSMDFLTDNRSEKIIEITKNPKVELCWLLPKTRSQFRLRGERIKLEKEMEEKTLHQYWMNLNPTARALWSWPAPGRKVSATDEFPTEIPENHPMLPSFELMRIEITQVELLELKATPHKRRRWRVEENWKEEYLNP